ncbi:MAG TPA: response regulator, partial [Pseudomonas sp.]
MSEKTATLLIVDDEVQVRKLLSVMLENQGYRTLTARSGEEALAMVEQEPPDLILL